MKLKRLFINVLLIGGVSLSSCASYSSDPNEVYDYLATYGTDYSNWEGVKASYTIETKDRYGSERQSMSYKIGLKASNYNNTPRALITLKGTIKYRDFDKGINTTSKGNYKIYIDDSNIYLNLKVNDDGVKESEEYDLPFTIPIDALIYLGATFIEGVDTLLKSCLNALDHETDYDYVKLNASLRETSNGASAKFKYSYKETTTYINNGKTYIDEGLYNISLKYDKDHYLESYSYTSEVNEDVSNKDYDYGTFKVEASSYNKKISTPSWAK